MKYALAGTLLNRVLSPIDGKEIFRTESLQDNTISVSVTEEEIRGGLSNKKLASYFHDSILNVTLTDALFDLNYLAQNFGGQVSVGGDTFHTETITTDTENQITVSQTPVDFLSFGKIGRYTIQGQDNWRPLTFVGKVATATELPKGSVVCVEYSVNSSTIQKFTISSAIIPNEAVLIVEAPLFNASTKVFSQSSRVGTLRVTVPRFLFSGSSDIGLTSAGASTTSISGSALAYKGASATCSSLGDYAYVELDIFGKTPEDGLVNLAIDGADIQMKVGTPYPLQVVGIYEDGSVNTNFDNTRLTFTATPSTNVTISNEGVITASQAVADVSLKVVATNKQSIETYGNITATTV